MEAKLLKAERFVDQRTGCSYRYVFSTTEYFRPHYHDYYEIFFVVDGTAQHIVNGGEFDLSRGSIVFIRPSDTHDYVCDKNLFYSMLNITFTTEIAEEIFSFLGEGFDKDALLSSKFPPHVNFGEREFEHLMKKMAPIRTIDVNAPQKLKTALKLFILEAFTKCFDTSHDIEVELPKWLQELCDKMSKNNNFIVGAGRMLELSGKSREHLSRSLKKYTGLTVSDYVNGLRIRFIANMLLNSNYSVADIVFESGFNNISWASRLFKQTYGVTMSQYRKGKEKTQT